MQRRASFTTVREQKNIPIVLELEQTYDGHVALLAHKANTNSCWLRLGVFKNGEFVLDPIDGDLAKALNLVRSPHGGIQTRPPNSSD